MRSWLYIPWKLYRIALLLLLTSLLSAWTCTAVVRFNSCPGAVPQPQISGLAPNSISADVVSVLLTIEGSSFVSQSEILWNGNPLQTTFMDSGHLQTTITQQTFDSFGGSAGSSVLISVLSPGSNAVLGCPDGGNSGTLVLDIN